MKTLLPNRKYYYQILTRIIAQFLGFFFMSKFRSKKRLHRLLFKVTVPPHYHGAGTEAPWAPAADGGPERAALRDTLPTDHGDRRRPPGAPPAPSGGSSLCANNPTNWVIDVSQVSAFHYIYFGSVLLAQINAILRLHICAPAVQRD